jgi:putative 4-mercaptohistidine N1-methyltranferase
MSTPDFYETQRAQSEYLLFHYGLPAQILPWAFGPAQALEYPARCVSECLDLARLPNPARALDLGCAVGRSTFELARVCSEVVGIDYSQRFIEIAQQLQREGSIAYDYIEEGQLTIPATAAVPADVDRQRVRFEQGDAQGLRLSLGQFDVVLMANLVDRLSDPKSCLDSLHCLVRKAGQLILTTPCTWLEEYTPRERWLGGFEQSGRAVKTLESIQSILAPDFTLTRTLDMPFLIREHARKFQWSVAQATIWVRR